MCNLYLLHNLLYMYIYVYQSVFLHLASVHRVFGCFVEVQYRRAPQAKKHSTLQFGNANGATHLAHTGSCKVQTLVSSIKNITI